MLSNSVLICFAILCLDHGISGYGNGAPSRACTSLVPVHTGISSQSSDTPYSITASASTYSPGEQITVTINGGDFQGLLVQARQDGQTVPLGTFSSPPSNTKLIKCNVDSDSWTHSSTTTKNDVTITWTAPSSDMGTIKFIGTVAQNKQMYWLNHQSGSLTYKASQTDPTTSPSEGTPTVFSELGPNDVTESSTPSNEVTTTGSSSNAVTGSDSNEVTGTTPGNAGSGTTPDNAGSVNGVRTWLVVSIIVMSLFSF